VRRALAALGAALTAAALTLTACGTNPDVHGTVTAKEHDAAHTSWRTEAKTKRVCTTSTRRTGKTTSTSRSCRSVPDGTRRVSHHEPECWELKLDSGDEVCVSAEKWTATAVGDRI
jgi:hypothetical protein